MIIKWHRPYKMIVQWHQTSGEKLMKLNQIRDVVAVAERGSLRSAARYLGIAQPAITRSIQGLERELGVVLFERHVSGVLMTRMGKALVQRAAGIQIELQRVHDEMEQLKGGTTGNVTIALSTAVQVALLGRVLVPFQQRFPGIHLRVIEGLFPAVEADVRQGLIDAYIGPMVDTLKLAELSVERLFDNHRVIVGRCGHPMRRAGSLSELIDARWVATSVTLVSEEELTPVFERYGLPTPKISVRCEGALSMIVIAASSDMLAMLPQQWLPFITETKIVERIAIREELAGHSICIVHRARLPLTPAAEYLTDLFRRAGLQHAATLPKRGL
jgi:LysR family transcriptional regulator, regulator of abg operon